MRLRWKLLLLVTGTLLLTLLAVLFAVHRLLERDLQQLLRSELTSRNRLFEKILSDAETDARRKAWQAARSLRLRALVSEEAVDAASYRLPMQALADQLGVGPEQIWAFNRTRAMRYPEALIDEVQAGLPDLAAVIPPLSTEFGERAPAPLAEPPAPVPLRVARLGGRLLVLATEPCLRVDRELLAEGEPGHFVEGAVVVAVDLAAVAAKVADLKGEDEPGAGDGAIVAALRDRGGLTYCSRPELQQALEAALATADGDVVRVGEEGYLVTVLPFGARHAGAPGALVLAQPFGRSLSRQMAAVSALLVFVGSLALALALGVSFWLTGTMTRPLGNLQRGVRHVAAGDLDIKVPVSSSDEIGELTASFNQMVVELHQKEMLKKMVSSGAVQAVEALEGAQHTLGLGGRMEHLTVLFSDIRDFTPLTERAGVAIVDILNRYFAVVGALIHDHGGDIDKFIGDAVMVTFHDREGEPGALRAVRCAAAMIQAMEEFNRKAAAAGEETLSIGVGIATGEVVAGNMGTPERLEFTVLGDTVNVAARLEGASKQSTHLPIMLDEQTHAAVAAHARCEPRTLELKGKGEQTIYELVEVEPPAPT